MFPASPLVAGCWAQPPSFPRCHVFSSVRAVACLCSHRPGAGAEACDQRRRAPVSDISQATSVTCVLALGASPDGLLRHSVGGWLSGAQARCTSSWAASDTTADGWTPATVLAVPGHARCRTLLCTALYRFHLTSDDRGAWTRRGLVFPACLVQSVFLQVETLGPWGGPGQRTSCGLPALAVPGRQGNMWTLAGDSWAGPWDSRP